MHRAIGNEKYFYSAVSYIFLILILYGYALSLLFDSQGVLVFFSLTAIIMIPILLFLERKTAFSFWLEKKIYFEKSFKIHWSDILRLLSLSIFVFPVVFFLVEFIDNFRDNPSLQITFKQDHIISYLGTSIGFFITLLALHWTVVATIFSTKYSKSPKEIQTLYFDHTKTKNITYYTSSYLLCAIIAYFYLSTLQLEKEETVFISLAFVVELQKIIPSLLHTEIQLKIFSLAFMSYGCWLLYYYISNSVNFIQLSNSYYLYELINKEIKYIIQKNAFIKDTSKYKKEYNILKNYISLLHDKINYDIKNKETTDKTYLEASIDYLKIIKIYWKNKNKFFYDTDWFPSTKRYNSLAEVIFTRNNIIITRDILYFENALLKMNKLIINILIESQNFTLLTNYYDELRQILIPQEKESLFTYNVPFFYETLNLLFTEITNDINLIREHNETKDCYNTISILNNILGNIFITNQAYLLKFNKTKINTIFPIHNEIIQSKNIQELCLKYPAINNEIGLKNYIKPFIERKVENHIITPNKEFYSECNLPLVQIELINILKLFQSVIKILQNNLTYFIDHNKPYYFFDTFLTFLFIKYEFLANYNDYEDIYKEYHNNKNKKHTPTFSLHTLVNFDQELPTQLTSIIKIYRNKNYFIQKEFPNLLNNIYELLINLLICHFNSKNIYFNNETKTTIKVLFHFLMLQQQIMDTEKESHNYKISNEEENISYNIPTIIFISLIGAGLQKGEMHKNNIINVFKEKFKHIEIKEYLFTSIYSILKENNLFSFSSIIQIIEHKTNTTNSIETFIEFITNFYSENNND